MAVLAKPQAVSPPGTARRPGAEGGDAVPQPGHVAGREDAEGEDDARDVAVHERLVVDLLAAHRLDREDVGAGLDAQRERTVEPLPGRAGAEQGRASLVADVGGSDAEGGTQAVLRVGLGQVPMEDRGDLGAPFGTVGHGGQQLELEHDARSVQGDGALEDVGGHLVVLGEDLGPGRLADVDDREREVDLGEDIAGADRQVEAAVDGLGRDAVQQDVERRDGEGHWTHSLASRPRARRTAPKALSL